MFAFIKSPVIYKSAEEMLVNFLINPSAVLRFWRDEKLTEADVGEIILNRQNESMVKLLPTRIATAIQNCKRKTYQSLSDRNEIVIIYTANCPQIQAGECGISYWGFRYITSSKLGYWQFEWGAPFVRFCGHRNSFLSGTNGLFSYKLGEFRILRMLTSEPNKPLIFQGAEITPDEVVLANFEKEREEFYLPLKYRYRTSLREGGRER